MKTDGNENCHPRSSVNQPSLRFPIKKLFVSGLSAQLLVFTSWKPDSMAMAMDTFTLDWSELPHAEGLCESF